MAALRRADDLPGAGPGLRLLAFTAAVSSGAREGPPVGSKGALAGIMAKRIARGLGGASAGAGFALPIETLVGLADGSGKQVPGGDAERREGPSFPLLLKG